MRRTAVVLALIGLAFVVLPADALAWSPGTHVFLGQTLLANLHLVPGHIAELLAAFPYDFLYGSIAADTSFAKKYAPVGRHSHAWHVGQEIVELAGNARLEAFGYGYLAHLAADVVAHNHFVPRQLAVTSTSRALGHSYWEARFDVHVGEESAHEAYEVLRRDHSDDDAHLDRIISPTLFSVATNRRLFRGMVQLTDLTGWVRVVQLAAEASRWDLDDRLVELHMALAFDYVVDMFVAGDRAIARRSDPSGADALTAAKRMRRHALVNGGRRNRSLLREVAEAHFGLPRSRPGYWEEARVSAPWRR